MKKIEYKVLLSDKTQYLKLPIGLSFKPVDDSELIDDYIEKETNKAINPIIDGEQQIYLPPKSTTISMEFRFYNNGLFSNDWTYVGFDVAGGEQKRNTFKKSFFALEFFDGNNSNNNQKLFTITLPTINNSTGIPNVNSSYSLTSPQDEGYMLFYDRNKALLDITGTTLWMKASFLSAKDGSIHKFGNISSDSTIGVDNYNDNMLYFKVVVYKDFTYQYFDTFLNSITNSLILRELIIV